MQLHPIPVPPADEIAQLCHPTNRRFFCYHALGWQLYA